ncbi:MAG: ABC transporter substrate-binding protein [Coriobacteriia bacterium]|nr:ABC transporter substrate-binding protein [Coriobacteriia bacterium]
MRARSLLPRWVVVAFAAALVVSLAGCGGAKSTTGGSADAADTYKVGAILSLTGTYAALGESEKNALNLEVKRINDAGGINGKKLDVIIEDDGTDEAKAVAAASKLVGQENVIAILGATGTGQSMAIRSEIDRAGIPQVSMAGGTAITANFSPLVFQTPWSNTIVVPFVLGKVASDGNKKIAVLSDSGGYGKDGLAVIKAEAGKAGLEIVSDQTFNAGDTDFSAQLTKVKSSGADALVLWTAGKEGASVVKGARDLGVTQPMYGGSGQAKIEFAQGAGEAAEGFIFGTGKSLTPANWGEGTPEFDVVNGFAERYKAAYGQSPDIFAGHAFDALAILEDALKRSNGDTSPAALTASVEGTKDLIGFGGAFTFTPTDHNGLTADDLALYEVSGGAWNTLK